MADWIDSLAQHLAQGGSDAPLFLVEGMTGLADARDRNELAARDVVVAYFLDAGHPVSVADLWTDRGGLDDLIYRRLAASFCLFVEQAHGRTALRSLVLGDLADPKTAVPAACAKPLSEVEAAWLAETRKPQPASLGLGGVLRAVAGYWRPHWRVGVTLLIALAVQQVFHTVFAFGLKAIIDSLQTGVYASLTLVLGGLGIAFLFAVGATIIGEYLAAKIAVSILNDLRRRLFHHLQRLSSDYYLRTRTGDIVSRFSSDLQQLKKSVTKRMVSALLAVVGLLINVPVLFVLDWRLALLTLVALPLMILMVSRLAPRASEASYELKKAQGRVAELVQENAQAQLVIQGFGLRRHAAEHFDETLDHLAETSVRADFLVALVGAASGLSVLLIQLAVVGAGAYMAFEQLITAGALVAFITLLTKVSKDAYDLSKKVVPELISASAGIRRFEEVMSELPRITDQEDGPILRRLDKGITFDAVSFTYTGETANLRDVNLTIPAGKLAAFVGPSGSGKSTALNLVTRFYDPTRGVVRFDDTPLHRCRLFSLRAQMGIVFQESFLFNTTIRDNIRLGNPRATDEEVEAAARAAEIHDIITAMPEGYDTNVGEGGGKLSGGQRQRIAIARAIVRNPSVLVLDEATSALDPGTEAALNETLYKLARGRTVISVTHRLAAITDFDCIFVMRDGVLVEQGTHDALVDRGGVYADLWAKQSGFAVSEDGRRATIDADRLAKLPLFDRVSDTALLEELTAQFQSEHFDAGDSILFEGQRTDRFFVVVRGRVETTQKCYSGGERRLGVLDQGDSFGMLPLLTDTPARAAYRALDPCLVITLSRSQFLSLTERSAEARDAIQTVKKQRYLEQLFGPRVRGSRTREYAPTDARTILGLPS